MCSSLSNAPQISALFSAAQAPQRIGKRWAKMDHWWFSYENSDVYQRIMYNICISYVYLDHIDVPVRNFYMLTIVYQRVMYNCTYNCL